MKSLWNCWWLPLICGTACGAGVRSQQPNRDRTGVTAQVFDSDDSDASTSSVTTSIQDSPDEIVIFRFDPVERAKMIERYCQSTGYECRESGWRVPEIAKKFGQVVRSLGGIVRDIHTYESVDGEFLIGFARIGGPVTAWEVDVKNHTNRYAIFDLDCDGVFEVKALKGYDFVSLSCTKTQSPRRQSSN